MRGWFGKKRTDPRKTGGEDGAPEREGAASATPEAPMVPVPSATPAASDDPSIATTVEAPQPATPPPMRLAGVRAVPTQPAAKVVPARALPEGGTKQRTLYKLLMNSLYDAVLITDNKGRIIDCNERSAELFGTSVDDLWDVPASRLIAGLNDSVYDRIRGAVGDDRFVLMNTRGLRKDGSKFSTEVGVSVVDLLGQNNFVFTVRNIDRRVSQLHSLQAGQNAFMNAQAGCFVCDSRHRIVAVNPAFLSLLGLTSVDQAVGLQIDAFLPIVAEFFVRVAAGESMLVEGEARQRASKFLIRIAPNRQGASHIDGLVGSFLPAPLPPG